MFLITELNLIFQCSSCDEARGVELKFHEKQSAF